MFMNKDFLNTLYVVPDPGLVWEPQGERFRPVALS